MDLSALAREVAAELHTQDPQRRVEWVIADELIAQGDAHLLSLALQNLMGNAWKFTGPRPQARIEVGALPGTSTASASASGKEEGGLVYFVRDNGVGFDMAYADKLFAPFQRLHGMQRVPRHGHRPGHRAAHHRPPRRARLGRGGSRSGRNLLFHAGECMMEPEPSCWSKTIPTTRS